MSWYRLDLGDALLAERELATLGDLCRRTFEKSGRPVGWAVYQAHVSGDLHCRAQLFFSPAASELARELGAQYCDELPEGPGLLAGDGAGLFD